MSKAERMPKEAYLLTSKVSIWRQKQHSEFCRKLVERCAKQLLNKQLITEIKVEQKKKRNLPTLKRFR